MPTRTTFRAVWIRSVTVGEFAGFCVPALVGAATTEAIAAISVPALCVAGAVEGGVLGWSQARVLGRGLADFPRRRWIVATSAGAAVAWAIGSVPMAAGDGIADLPAAVVVAIGVGAGLLLLATMGTAQWLVIRRAAQRSWRWIPATAGCWLVALAAFMAVSMPLWQPGQSTALVAGIGALAGLVMAGVFALASGSFAERILAAGTEPSLP